MINSFKTASKNKKSPYRTNADVGNSGRAVTCPVNKRTKTKCTSMIPSGKGCNNNNIDPEPEKDADQTLGSMFLQGSANRPSLSVEKEVDRLMECARAYCEKEKFKLKQFYEEELVRKKKIIITEFRCAMEREILTPLKRKLCEYEKEIYRIHQEQEKQSPEKTDASIVTEPDFHNLQQQTELLQAELDKALKENTESQAELDQLKLQLEEEKRLKRESEVRENENSQGPPQQHEGAMEQELVEQPLQIVTDNITDEIVEVTTQPSQQHEGEMEQEVLAPLKRTLSECEGEIYRLQQELRKLNPEKQDASIVTEPDYHNLQQQTELLQAELDKAIKENAELQDIIIQEKDKTCDTPQEFVLAQNFRPDGSSTDILSTSIVENPAETFSTEVLETSENFAKEVIADPSQEDGIIAQCQNRSENLEKENEQMKMQIEELNRQLESKTHPIESEIMLRESLSQLESERNEKLTLQAELDQLKFQLEGEKRLKQEAEARANKNSQGPSQQHEGEMEQEVLASLKRKLSECEGEIYRLQQELQKLKPEKKDASIVTEPDYHNLQQQTELLQAKLDKAIKENAALQAIIIQEKAKTCDTPQELVLAQNFRPDESSTDIVPITSIVEEPAETFSTDLLPSQTESSCVSTSSPSKECVENDTKTLIQETHEVLETSENFAKEVIAALSQEDGIIAQCQNRAETLEKENEQMKMQIEELNRQLESKLHPTESEIMFRDSLSQLESERNEKLTLQAQLEQLKLQLEEEKRLKREAEARANENFQWPPQQHEGAMEQELVEQPLQIVAENITDEIVEVTTQTRRRCSVVSKSNKRCSSS